MSLIWPRRGAENPSIFGRLGRLVFWIATALAALLVAGTTYGIFFNPGMVGVVFDYGAAVVVFLAGRGVCYLLASE